LTGILPELALGRKIEHLFSEEVDKLVPNPQPRPVFGISVEFGKRNDSVFER
jgi:hypothetical protein